MSFCNNCNLGSGLSVPSVSVTHKTVHHAMETLLNEFKQCFDKTMPSSWRMTIEKDVWKHLMLDLQPSHFKKFHVRSCDGGFKEHTLNYTYNFLVKLLKKHDDRCYQLSKFEEFHKRKYVYSLPREQCRFRDWNDFEDYSYMYYEDDRYSYASDY